MLTTQGESALKTTSRSTVQHHSLSRFEHLEKSRFYISSGVIPTIFGSESLVETPAAPDLERDQSEFWTVISFLWNEVGRYITSERQNRFAQIIVISTDQ